MAIETSCDETAVAVLDITGLAGKPDIRVLGNALFSQAHIHEEYGGVYPNLAKREHIKNLPILLEKVLKEARSKKQEANISEEIDVIAVTQGPGLEPALWTGITFAQDLGRKWGKPVMPVNHMAGHIWSVLVEDERETKLPALALLVSGGHTEIVLAEDFGRYEVIGRTRDDAAGEAFDKVARMLGLPYPGGPKVSQLAEAAREKGEEAGFEFPRPMLHTNDFDFSFSGLKTAVLYKIKELGEIDESMKRKIARAFEDAAIEVLVAKTRRALERYPDSKTLIVGGGVAANRFLRLKISELQKDFPEVSIKFPIPSLTTDNAVMIGAAAYIEALRNPKALEGERDIKARGNLLLGS